MLHFAHLSSRFVHWPTVTAKFPKPVSHRPPNKNCNMVKSGIHLLFSFIENSIQTCGIVSYNKQVFKLNKTGVITVTAGHVLKKLQGKIVPVLN
jgi:hypothetical protein